MKLLDGKQVAKTIQREAGSSAKQFAETYGRPPGLATVLVGQDPASAVYVKRKGKACLKNHIHSLHVSLPSDVSESELIQKIEDLNQDEVIDGILVQLPLPSHLSEHAILQAISPAKDVDGFHPINAGRMFRGEKSLLPCTPAGIIRLLEHYEIPMQGKQAVVLGRSNIVGKPMFHLCLQKNATVTMCHSKTENVRELCSQADILIAAVGRPEMVKADWVKPGACVVDVGINRGSDGRLVGDVDFEAVKEKAGFLSPVPGGVGPLTISMLLVNTVQAANSRQEKDA